MALNLLLDFFFSQTAISPTLFEGINIILTFISGRVLEREKTKVK